MAIALSEVIGNARKQLGELTGLPISSTVSVRRSDDGWAVRMEVVEKRSLPDSQDILATYGLALDEAGNVLNFARVGMRRRMDVSVGSEVEAGV